MGKQLWGVALAFVASLVGLGLVITSTTPDASSPLLKALFFLALFMVLWSLVTLIFYAFRKTISILPGFCIAFILLMTALIYRLLSAKIG